jgi:hypothetical protein
MLYRRLENQGAELNAAGALTAPARKVGVPMKKSLARSTARSQAVCDQPTQAAGLPIDRPDRAILDGRTLVFAAEEEIRLVCGKSSITLHKSGRVVIKGVEIVSRGTRTNKVKGGAVHIN